MSTFIPVSPGPLAAHDLWARAEAMIEAWSLGRTVYHLGEFSAGPGEDGSRTPEQGVNRSKSCLTKNAIALVPCHNHVLRPVLHRRAEAAMRRAKGGP